MHRKAPPRITIFSYTSLCNFISIISESNAYIIKITNINGHTYHDT